MLLEELLKEEREAGRTEGLAQGKAKAVLELLSDLGEVPEELREKILGEKELDVLKFYLRKSSIAKSIEEFQELIREKSKGVVPV